MTSIDAVQGYSIVRDQAALEAVVAEAAAAGRVGLDTEFLREKTYRARLCLVQIATPSSLALIDPLEEVDVSNVGELLSDQGVEVVVHAGKQDFEVFFDRLGSVPTNVFDVQVAAGFAGHGASLPYGRLVESVLGIKITKGESYSDWCTRPLTDEQLSYAADDVRWLLPAADKLEGELSALARLDWAREEMTAFQRAELYRVDPADAWRKVSGRGSLSGRQLAVLAELARWREETARRRDIPRGWVIKDPTLVELARRGPRDLKALQRIRGMNAREAERSAREILAVIERGRNAEPIADQSSAPRQLQARARMLSGLADAVVRARCDQARIATELVTTRGELEAIIAGALTSSATGTGELSSGAPEGEAAYNGRARLLKGWRFDLAGRAVLDLVAGRTAVRAIDSPPYIEEVSMQ